MQIAEITTEVVLNKKYGGFSLSNAVMELYLTRKGLAYYIGNDQFGNPVYHLTETNMPVYDYQIKRTDATLLSVVRDLGDAANTVYSQLVIEEITMCADIDSYDGKESITVSSDYL
jgi:hypothetical protein